MQVHNLEQQIANLTQSLKDPVTPNSSNINYSNLTGGSNDPHEENIMSAQ